MLRSIRQRMEIWPESVAERMLSVTQVRAVSLECRLPRTEAMLGWGKEMIGGEVVVELALSHTFHYLGGDRYDGYGTVV